MITLAAAVARLSREVPAAEAAIDEAMLRVSDVFRTTLTARHETEVAPSTAHVTLMRLHKSVGGLLGAHADMIRAHGELVKDGKEVGVADEPYCPGQETFTGASFEGEPEIGLKSIAA